MNSRLPRMMKKHAVILNLCILLILCSGCWDRTEVNDLALITAMGVDAKDEDRIELSIQVFIPKQSGGGMQQMGPSGGGQSLVRSAQGITIADAMAKLQEKFPRRLFWGHCEIFIFGEELAREGIRGHIDLLMRHPQIRERGYVLVSQNKAKDILRLQPPLERTSSEVLREMATEGTGLGITLKDLNQMLSSDAEAAALPWVKRLSRESTGDGKTIPYISGAAVFKRDKMIGRISDRATRGVLWLRNEVKSAIATLTLKREGGYISMAIIRARTNLSPKIENDRWIITIKAEADASVFQNTTRLQVMEPEITRMLEKELETDVKRLIKSTLNQVQKEMKADFIGFSEAFHRAYPDEWKRNKERWDVLFPTVEVRFAVDSRLRRPGVLSAPAGLPDEEVKK